MVNMVLKKNLHVGLFPKICRTCLSIKEESCSVFEVNCDNTSIVHMLEKYTSIKISKQDGLPISMCQDCILLLCQSYNFFELTLKSNTELKNILAKSQIDLQTEESEQLEIFEINQNNEFEGEEIIIEVEVSDDDDDIEFINADDVEFINADDETVRKNETETKNLSNNLNVLIQEDNTMEITPGQKKTLSCHLCLFSCPTSEELSAHYAAVKHSDDCLKCSDCGCIYKSKKMLLQHMKNRHNIQIVNNEIMIEEDEAKIYCLLCNECVDAGNLIDHFDEYHSSCKSCISCYQQFDSPEFVRKHIVFQHTYNEQFFCGICKINFVSLNDFEKHIDKDEHVKKECSTYEIVLPQNNSDEHKQESKNIVNVKTSVNVTEEKVKEYKCNVCNAQFTYRQTLKRHLLGHADNEDLNKVSEQNTLSQRRLENSTPSSNSIKKDCNPRAYSCDTCNIKFETNEEFTNHLKTHGEITTYQCRICKSEYLTKEEQRNHMDVHKKLQCKYCSKRYAYNSSLYLHMMTHKNNGPGFPCIECGKNFSQKSYLKYHMYKHTGAKPYECTICGKTFRQPAHLKSHHVQHSGKWPYACKICNKEFLVPSLLKIHTRLHTGERPYRCPICDKTFHDLTIMKRHRRTHLALPTMFKNFKNTECLSKEIEIFRIE